MYDDHEHLRSLRRNAARLSAAGGVIAAVLGIVILLRAAGVASGPFWALGGRGLTAYCAFLVAVLSCLPFYAEWRKTLPAVWMVPVFAAIAYVLIVLVVVLSALLN
ncbi:hypothetical protein [Pseudoroseicyclus aestuarii]|uniref:Uncharacterized protein n=1 Tax=Pseudoroseicyclus aestuarii TaxID=1795041 RepID=A0A318T0A7_9RHOB|nr:hypothetical protein [Pseudoroseicyclus aestuarii]PYE82527.1 hypothetical protein DFP88_104284 [Pseudoroseicyclus aestuarii]